MFRLFLFSFCSFLLPFISHAQQAPRDLNNEQFKAMMADSNVVVVDVRTSDEYQAGHIPNTTLHIDYYKGDFKEQVSKLDTSKTYILYCRSGYRSGKSIAIFKNLGFTSVHHLDGGITKWNGSIEKGSPSSQVPVPSPR